MKEEAREEGGHEEAVHTRKESHARRGIPLRSQERLGTLDNIRRREAEEGKGADGRRQPGPKSTSGAAKEGRGEEGTKASNSFWGPG